MKKTIIVWALVIGIASFGAVACSSDSSTADSTGAGTESQPPAQEGMEQAQQGMAQMMEGLQQMAQGQGGQTTPVDYEVLKELLPEFSGWERSDVKGQQVTTIVSVSNAQATYRNGDASMTLELTDTSLSQLLLAPFAMMAKAGYSERSDAGYKRATTLAGYPGFETWENASGDAEVSLLVADRFIVRAEGSGLGDAEPARALVQAVDLTRLAALK